MWSHHGGVMYELGHIFLMIQNIRGMETIVLTAFFAYSLSKDSYSQSSMTDEAFGIFWNTTRNRQDHTLNVQCWHCWSGIIASSFHVVLRSSDTRLLHKPTTRTLFAGRAFCCTPTVWNSLINDVVSSTSLAVFKSTLMTFLFRQTFRPSRFSRP